MKKIALFLFLVLIAVCFWLFAVAAVAFFAAKEKGLPGVSQGTGDYFVGEVWGAKEVGQTFTPKHNYLSRIDLMLATYARNNTKDIVFHLLPVPSCVPEQKPSLPNLSQVGWAGEIQGNFTVGQTFVPSSSPLYGIRLFMANYLNRSNTEEVVFHLRSSPSTTDDLATVRVNASTIRDDGFHTFSFPTLEVAIGREYYFFVESPKSYPGNAVTVGYLPDSTQGTRYISGRPEKGSLIFEPLYHEEAGDILKVIVNASAVKDNQYHSFTFPPIADSAGKCYYFYVESPDSLPGNAITVRASSADVYPEGTATIDGSPIKGDLEFRSFYDSASLTKGEFFSGYISAFFRHKPAFLGELPLASLLMLYFAAILGLFVLIRRADM